jgi:SSS family solute:Na+ symporter
MTPSTSVHFIDYLIIILTLVISLGFGFWFSKRQKNTKSFFTAGGNIPSWIVGMSILATLISSITFLAYPGEGYKSNWILLVQGLMVPVVLFFMIGFVVPLFRNVIKLSAYEYFEKRFGFLARLYASVSFLVMQFSSMGTVFFLIALALNQMIGLDPVLIIWILGISIILITAMGGMEAIVWLDVVQGVLLIAGGVISLAILLFTPEGGPATVWKVAMENGRIGFGPFDWDFVNLTFIVMALNGIFYAIQKYGTDQTIVQRYLTARSDRDAIRASLLGISLSVVVWFMFMFIGTALFSFYHVTGKPLPEGIRPDAVFPYFMMTELPVGVMGLVLSALIATAIGSIDSALNGLSAILMEDYYLRFRSDSSEKHRLWMSKVCVLFGGLVSIGIALIYVNLEGEGILGIIFTLYAIFSGGIAGMFLLGIFSTRANKQGLYWGIGACILFTAWALLTSTPMGLEGKETLLVDLGDYNFTHHPFMIGVYSHLVMIFFGYTASLMYKGKKPDLHLTWYGRTKQTSKNLKNQT